MIGLQIEAQFHLQHFAVVLLQHVSRFQQLGEGLLVANWFYFLFGHDFFFHQFGNRPIAQLWPECAYSSANPILPKSGKCSKRGMRFEGGSNALGLPGRWALKFSP
jgi:hypothetical protein